MTELHVQQPATVRAELVEALGQAQGERGKGRLFGVSLGPGDPGLITRRAWALLERADTVLPKL